MRGLLKLTENLKILFITYTHSNGGGAEAILTTLVNNLPKTWKIDILEVVGFDVKKEPINKGINLLPPLTKNKDRTKFGIFFRILLLHKPELIKDIRCLEDYDVVVGYLYLYSTFLLPFFYKGKKIVWFQGMMDDIISCGSLLDIDYYVKRTYFKVQKKVLECVDSAIVPSNMCLRCLRTTFSEICDKVKIIYNGVDIKKINKKSEAKITNSKLLEVFQQQAPSLIVIGRLDRNKNFSLALEAVKILKMRGVSCQLIVLGFETEDVDLHKLANSLGIEKQVYFLGYQQNPLPFLARSKLLLITSFAEGFPTVAIEAMSLGIPFVTTPVSGASEELANNDSCGLVSDWNATEYADKIEKLITDEALYQKMSKACKEHIKNYSVGNFVKSFENLLDEIPEKRRKTKDRKTNYFLSTLLFIFYSSFYLSVNNHHNRDVMKVRWLNLIYKPSFLNFCKLIYRFFIYLGFVLSFPLLLLYASFLVFRKMKL